MTSAARGMAATVVFAVALAAYAVLGLRVGSDFAAFLPRGDDAVQRVLVAQLRDGVAGRLLSIELSGDAPATLARQSTLLAERIGGDALFRYVANGSAGFGEREIAVLEHHRYVLSDRVAPSRFEVPALRDALETRLEELAGSAGPIVKQSLASDPTAETREVLRRIAPGTGPGRLHGVWFDPTRTRALLVAETRASGAELDAQQSAIDSLERAFAAVAAGTSARIRYSSAGAIAAQSRTLIAEQAARITVVSAILIVAILAWAYRSFAAVLLCGVPAVIGWLAGVVAVDLAFGGVHGITLAFGATLLGEAVDYPSFLLTQARRGESLFATRQRIGRWLWLAVLTTACGSVALVLSGFRGLMQLGMLTIVGIGVAGVVTWHGVPQWISPGWSARPRDPARALRVPSSAPTGVRMLMVAIAVFVALASTWHRPVWDDDPARLNPLPAELIVRDRELRDELGGPDARMLVLVRGASLQDVLQRSERLRGMLEAAQAAGEIKAFDVPSDYLPSDATQATRRAALPGATRLHANLQEAAAGLPFRADVFAPFEREIDAARNRPPLTIDSYEGTALMLKVRALLSRDADGFYAIVPLQGVREAPALVQRVASSDDASLRVLDLRSDAAALLGAYRRRALHASGGGALLIFGVLAFGLQSVSRALWVIAPVAAAVVVTACSLVTLGGPLTIFHLLGLLLIVGIGVNYAMFALRAREAPVECRGTVRTLAVVSATTLCAFAGLAASSIQVLHAIGSTVCIGVVSSLAFSAILLYPRTTAESA